MYGLITIMELGFAQEVLSGGGFSRKGAKTQSAAAFLRGFLCAFAPLREKNPFSHRALARFEYFLCKPARTRDGR